MHVPTADAPKTDVVKADVASDIGVRRGDVSSSPADDASLPAPKEWVTDQAGILTPEQKSALNAQLAEIDRSHLAQVIIYIAAKLPDGVKLEEFTLTQANAWGIGHADRDDGIVIFLFVAEKKIRIEVGYGLQAKITSELAKGLIVDQIAPSAEKGAYAAGLSNAVAELSSRIATNSITEPASRD